MRKQLGKFIEFSKGILPHEVDYLLHINRLQDPDRLAILERLQYNSQQFPPGEDFDTGIDKRTYSHLKNWIQKQLGAIDVDHFYSWLSQLDIKIVEDSIEPKEEHELLRAIDNYAHPGFYFTKFFEVLQHYSNFLLVRLRYKDHDRVSSFLEQYRSEYLHHKEVQERFQQASAVIVREYNAPKGDGEQWRAWLTEVFYDESLQGYLRYQSLIRLHYLDLRSEDHHELLEKYELVGAWFKEGRFYSKRLLINYYHNLMLLRHKARDFEAAVRYGRLAIRVKTHDYLLYVNNLCDVLVHQGRYEEGLALLRGAAKEARQTNNYFNRVGFVAFYMQCLLGVGQAKNAASYGSSFLAAYPKEVVKYRWYRFFSAYLESLLRNRDYGALLRSVRKFKLLEKEAEMARKPGGIRRMQVMQAMARYMLGELEGGDFQAMLTGVEKEVVDRLLEGDLVGFEALGPG